MLLHAFAPTAACALVLLAMCFAAEALGAADRLNILRPLSRCRRRRHAAQVRLLGSAVLGFAALAGAGAIAAV